MKYALDSGKWFLRNMIDPRRKNKTIATAVRRYFMDLPWKCILHQTYLGYVTGHDESFAPGRLDFVCYFLKLALPSSRDNHLVSMAVADRVPYFLAHQPQRGKTQQLER